MNTPRLAPKFRSLFLAAIGTVSLLTGVARAGNIYLTGHDTLLHSGQDGYSNVILEYLRNGEGTTASYDVLVITSGGVPGGVAAVVAGGYAVTTITKAAFNSNPAAALVGKDAIAISWDPDGGAVTASAALTSFFNAGGDIWANSGLANPSYYNFLPPGVAASGPALSGNPSSGFVATAAGVAIGITDPMINGDPTHNIFNSYAPAFTVMERYLSQTGEVISIGLRDGVITTGGITTGGTVPDSGSTVLLLAIALPILALLRRRVRS